MSIATSEVRKKAITAYRSGKGTQQQVADMYGIHLNTLKNWLKDYASDGRIEPRPRGHMPQTFSEDEKQKIHDMIHSSESPVLVREAYRSLKMTKEDFLCLIERDPTLKIEDNHVIEVNPGGEF